jgi:oxygen-dependent protoporphyrinogen oxidase
MPDAPARVAVVGAGVTGLTAAFRLQADPSIEVVALEASHRPGGTLRTVEVAGISLDAGPDSFLGRKPWAADLCRELGLEMTRPAATGTWLWTRGGLVPYPAGTAFGIPGDLGDLFHWKGLSGRGRRRALCDLVIRKRRDDGDETLGGLLRRRLGDEATDRALAPLLSGLFGGDVDSLSADATFPELHRWEQTQGSLIRGAQAALRDAKGGSPRAPMFVRPRDGAARLTAELAERAGDRVRFGASVEAIAREDDRWGLRTASGPVHADAVVLAVDPATARRLLEPVARDVSADLAQIPAVSVGVVLLVYPDGSAERLPTGAGFVVPHGEAPMVACGLVSAAWPDPAFGSRAVVRCTVGGAGQEDVLDADDQDIVRACTKHLAALLPLPGEAEASAVIRWPGAVPRYLLGHLERVGRIRHHLPPGIFLSGHAYDGIDVAGCVRGAAEAAEVARNFVDATRKERTA